MDRVYCSFGVLSGSWFRSDELRRNDNSNNPGSNIRFKRAWKGFIIGSIDVYTGNLRAPFKFIKVLDDGVIISPRKNLLLQIFKKLLTHISKPLLDF